jgi:hypothetical protein
LLLLLLLLLRLRQHGTGSFSTISAAAIRKNLLLVACISISTSSITRASGNSIAEFGLKVAVVQVSIRHHGLQIIRRATQLSPPCMVNTIHTIQQQMNDDGGCTVVARGGRTIFVVSIFC